VKPQPNRHYNTVTAYILLVIAFALFCLGFCLYFDRLLAGLNTLKQVLKPIVYGFVMAFLLSPLLHVLQDRVFAFTEKSKPHPRLRKALSILVTYLVLAAILVAFVAGIIPQVMESYHDFSQKFRYYVSSAQHWIDHAFASFPDLNITIRSTAPENSTPIFYANPDGSVPDLFGSHISRRASSPMYKQIRSIMTPATQFNIADLLGSLIDSWYRLLTDLTPYLLSAAMTLVTEAKNLLIGLMVSVYVLIDSKKLLAMGSRILRAFLPGRLLPGLSRTGGLIYHSFIRFFSGKIADSLLLGMLCLVLMTLFGLPYPPIVSLIVGVTNIIPYIGPILGVTVTAFLVFIARPSAAIGYMIMIIALHQLDTHFLEPYIVQSKIRLSSLGILSAVIIMGGLFGLVGMTVAVPLFAVLQTLLTDQLFARLTAKDLPTELSAWKK